MSRDSIFRPEYFAIREHNLRGVNLPRFPYHFLFRLVGDAVRILIVRFGPQRHGAFQRIQERPSVKKLVAYEKEVNEEFVKTA